MITRKMMLLVATATSCFAPAACQDNGPKGTSNTPAPTAAPNAAPETTAVANTNAVVASDPLANVQNKDRVKEYPDEIKISPPKSARLITGFSEAVRDAPNGEALSVIETASNVVEVAREPKGDYYLVVYSDPRDATKKLAGWVYKDALENNGWAMQSGSNMPAAPNPGAGANPAGAVTKLNCKKGQAHLRTDRDFCAKMCADDKGCEGNAGEVCDGLAFEVHEGNNKLSNVGYCVATRGTNPQGQGK